MSQTRRVTSARNPAVLAARRLARPAGRGAAGRFLLEGAQVIAAALGAGAPLEQLFATDEAARRHAGLLAQAQAAGATVLVTSAEVVAAIAQTVTPQGLVAVARSVARGLEGLPPAPRLVCVLAGVSDPGNAGTVVRAADAFGADAVATTAGSVDIESPKAVRATAGSLFHLPVLAGVPWPGLRDALRDRGLALVGADPHAPRAVTEAPLDRPVAVVLGSEARGLSAGIRADLDLTVRLPQWGRAESLNLAAAAAVLLYEAGRRQREEVPVG